MNGFDITGGAAIIAPQMYAAYPQDQMHHHPVFPDLSRPPPPIPHHLRYMAYQSMPSSPLQHHTPSPPFQPPFSPLTIQPSAPCIVRSASGSQNMFLSPLPSPAPSFTLYSPPMYSPNAFVSRDLYHQYAPCMQPVHEAFLQPGLVPQMLPKPEPPVNPHLVPWNNAVKDMDRTNALRTKIGLIVNQRYEVQQEISFGSYGTIYAAYDRKHQHGYVAVKFETSSEDSHLKYEFDLYKVLNGGPRRRRRMQNKLIGVPKVFWFGKEYEQRMMVMSLLGPSLENLFTYCDRVFCKQTIVNLGDQMVSRIQWLHDRGFVHRDLKPENFLVGIGDEERTLFLIDFGLARRYRYRDGVNLVHIPFRKGKSLVGTAKYASLNAHNGFELSRRDDIESLGYVLAELCCGELPWKEAKHKGRHRTKQQNYNRIRNMKEATIWRQVCPPVADLLEYAKNLEFADEPNYALVRSLVHAMANFNASDVHNGSIPQRTKEEVEIEKLTEQMKELKKPGQQVENMVWNSTERGSKRHVGRLFMDCKWTLPDRFEFNWIVRRESCDEERGRFCALFKWAHPSMASPVERNTPTPQVSEFSGDDDFDENDMAVN